ncbi:MAG: dihydropteroate synthase [Muricauda sp.]|nr:dihydropteroate synthase [Allomuricauda sp.]MAU26254.1 dihydropteroate synthase [Allomuricauda sp.]MBC31132.1 dihydropteroate synthase [Allomuricauda sp.]|tara:strand:+ start:843 stop:1679 length:837 start_codon:yes stop_codon:yes gene_type:complete
MTINCKGQLIDLARPKVMGILNVTPDSFYDGGKYKSDSAVLAQVEKMLSEGATFIDVGAYSSRPGASHISEEEELKRIVKMVERILEKFPEALLSIDTFRSKVATACLQAGAAIINDISAGNLDGNMLDTIAKFQVPYIMMHMRGTPQTMLEETHYDNVTKEVCLYFSKKIALARAKKLNDIIIDPGFGFSKTLPQNYSLLSHLELLHSLRAPLLVGISRKSMVYKLLGTDPENALNGTTALHTVALLKGAQILRAHDVKEAMECIKIIAEIKNQNGI